MQEIDFYRADTLDDLHRLLAETGGRVIAGGTDALVQMQRGAFPAACVVDASRIADLRYIRVDGDLLALDAAVTLSSVRGARILPLSQVLCGPRQTCLEPGEIIASIAFRRLPEPSGMAFIKLSNRRGMSIAVASAAAALALDPAGRIADGRIALGAVAPTQPIRRGCPGWAHARRGVVPPGGAGRAGRHLPDQ